MHLAAQLKEQLLNVEGQKEGTEEVKQRLQNKSHLVRE